MRARIRGWRWGLALLLLAGCAGDRDPVLVEVGGTRVRLGEFQRAFDEILVQDAGYQPDSASARRFLQTYIDKVLVEQLAADSIPWTPLLEHRARNLLENEMIQRLRQDAYGQFARPEEKDLRALYDKADTRYHFAAVAYPTPAEAEATLRMLREGAVFERIAAQRGATADQGWQTVLTSPEAIIDELAGMQPGQVSGPIHTPGRYWIVQLIEKAPSVEVPAFDDLRRDLERKIQIERGGLAVEAYHARLLKDYDYRTSMPEVLWLTQLLREKTRDVPRSFRPRTDAEGNPLEESVQDPLPWPDCPIPKDDWERPIGTSRADTITAIIVLDDLMSKLQHTWPTFESPDDVLALTQALMIDRIERAETWAKGYDKHPDMQWNAAKRRNQIHTRQFYIRCVLNRTRPSAEEARAWYEEHSAEFREPGRRRCLQVIVATWDEGLLAQRLLREHRGPQEALAAIRSALPAARASSPNGVAITEGQLRNALERQIFAGRPGDVTDPFPLPTGFTVLRIEEGVEGRTPEFEEITRQVVERVGEQAADSLFKEILAERRASTPIAVNEKVLLKLRYPAQTQPAAAPAGTR